MAGVESIYFTVTGSDKFLRIFDNLAKSVTPPFFQKVGDPKYEVSVTTQGNKIGRVDVQVSKDGSDWLPHEQDMRVEAEKTYSIDDKAFPASAKKKREAA
ncbi:MAG: hypothetical protein E5Y61_16125 [Mesorhizobium sp.]|nr:MAG: hypothetical protein E5Y61_16125 [Mesorhizobium sp.]